MENTLPIAQAHTNLLQVENKKKQQHQYRDGAKILTLCVCILV